MSSVLIVIFAVILLGGLLYFVNKENRKGILPTKTILSSLFIFTVMVQPHPMIRYYHYILVGLMCCLVGDVFLAFPQKKMFLLGLIAFLWGHVFYILGFFHVAAISQWTWMGSFIVIVISVWVFLWLRPHLGTMKIPVLFYIIVITFMVSGAWSILGEPNLALSGRIMVFTGALSFYFSDIFVARNHFLKNEFLNRLMGLPMYYTGQFLLAFSVGILWTR